MDCARSVRRKIQAVVRGFRWRVLQEGSRVYSRVASLLDYLQCFIDHITMFIWDQRVEHRGAKTIEFQRCHTAYLILRGSGVKPPCGAEGACPVRVVSDRILDQIKIAILADDHQSSLHSNSFQHV